MTKQHASKLGLGLLILLATSLLVLYHLSAGHIANYLTWRWMVTFQRPIHPVHDYHIVVHKAAHRLELYQQTHLLATYPIGISHRGTAPRQVWEDELTPEGTFLVASMQYQSRYGPRQMLLETSQQARAHYLLQYGEAGQHRLTTWEAEHGPLDTIWETYDFNEEFPHYPMWNDILIHGGGSDRDWTWGCIALDDPDMVALFDVLQRSQRHGIGVAVSILP